MARRLNPRAAADLPPLRLQIDALDLEGRGVARNAGKVVFVDGALPGETVLAAPLRSRASYDSARVVAIESASTQRVAPVCPHFGLHAGACGACAMQHLHPDAQVAVKQRALEDALARLGGVHPERLLRPLTGSAWAYRQRARLSVRDVPGKGGVLVGFHERASSYVADMRICHVLAEPVGQLLLPLRELVAALSIRRRLPQIEVAIARPGAGSVTVLVLRVLDPPTAADCAILRAFAQAHGVAIWLQPGGPATAAPLAPEDAVQLRLELPEFGLALGFGPTDFTQVDHRLNAVLVGTAVNLLAPRPDEHVVDLFCGLGNFTLPLATRAARVTGIEGAESLVRRAADNAARNGLAERARFQVGNLFDFDAVQWAALGAEHAVGAVLVDPPREGALAVARTLAATAAPPRRLVYVSCNPATLARDCAIFVHEGGWRLRAAGVVNLFPHTAHVESIAVLEPPA